MKAITDAILAELKAKNAELEKCRGYQKKMKGRGGSPYKLRKLERIEAWLGAERVRLATCLDIINGRAFVITQEESQGDEPAELTVAKPSPSQARLVDLMEKMGGKVTSYHVGEREEP